MSENNNPTPLTPIPDKIFKRQYEIIQQHEELLRSVVENMEVWRTGLYGFGERHEIPTWTGIQDQLAGSELYMLSKVMSDSEYIQNQVSPNELKNPDDINESSTKTEGRHRVWRGTNTNAIDMESPKIISRKRFVQHIIYGEGDRISLRVRSSEEQKEGAEHDSYVRDPDDIRGQLMLHGGASASWIDEAFFHMSSDTNFRMTEHANISMSQNADINATGVSSHNMHDHSYFNMSESAWSSMTHGSRLEMTDWSNLQMYDRSSLAMSDSSNMSMFNNSRQVLSEDSLIVMRGNEHPGWNSSPNKQFNPDETDNVNIINDNSHIRDSHGDHRRSNPHAFTRGGAFYVDKNDMETIIPYEHNRWEKDEKGRWVVTDDTNGKAWSGSPWVYMAGEPQLQMRIRSELFMTESSSINMIGTSRVNTNDDSRVVMRGGTDWYDRDGEHLTKPYKYYLEGQDTIGVNGVDVSNENSEQTLYELAPEDRYNDGSPWFYLAGQPRFQMRLDANLFMTESSSVSMWHDARFHIRNDSKLIMRGGTRWGNSDETSDGEYVVNLTDDGDPQTVINEINDDGSLNLTAVTSDDVDEDDLNGNLYLTDMDEFENSHDNDEEIVKGSEDDDSFTMYNKHKGPTQQPDMGPHRLPVHDRFYFTDSWVTTPLDPWDVSEGDIEELPSPDRRKAGSPWFYLAGQPQLQLRQDASLFMNRDTDLRMYNLSSIEMNDSSRFDMNGSSHLQGTGNGHLHFTNSPPNYTSRYSVGYEAHLNAADETTVLPGQRLLTIGTLISRTDGSTSRIATLNDLRRPGNYVLENKLSSWGSANPDPTTLTHLTQFQEVTSENFHNDSRRVRLEVLSHSYDNGDNVNLIQRLTTAPHNKNDIDEDFNKPMTFQRSWDGEKWTPWVKILDSLDKLNVSALRLTNGQRLLGRGGVEGPDGAGDVQEIILGKGLSFEDNVLNSSGSDGSAVPSEINNTSRNEINDETHTHNLLMSHIQMSGGATGNEEPKGKRLFVQSEPPSAEEASVGDVWIG